MFHLWRTNIISHMAWIFMNFNMPLSPWMSFSILNCFIITFPILIPNFFVEFRFQKRFSRMKFLILWKWFISIILILFHINWGDNYGRFLFNFFLALVLVLLCWFLSFILFLLNFSVFFFSLLFVHIINIYD